MNIKEVEPRFAQQLENPLRDVLQNLSYSLPAQSEIRVALLDSNGRKKRSNASADNWSPVSGRIEIWFEQAQPEQQHLNSAISKNDDLTANTLQSPIAISGAGAYMHPAEADLLKALDRAESRPGWSFVPLKKFRDEILPLESFSSIRTEVEQHNVLRSVIEKKFVLLGGVQNPKAPQFPVTTIRLNKLMPEVKAALGQSGNSDLDFHPVNIPGEPLSATVLRERR